MMEPFSKKSYQRKVEAIFTRFPSVQKVPFKDAYKPGLRICSSSRESWVIRIKA